MWYKINGDLINMNRVVDIYIRGDKELVFILDVPIAGAGGGDSCAREFQSAETIIKFSNSSKRDECFNKLIKALNAKII